MLHYAKASVNAERPCLLNVVTTPLMVAKLPGQLQYLQDRGFEVTVISPEGEGLRRMTRIAGVRAIKVPMTRQISPLRDLLSLWRLWRIVRALRPVLTNVGTPKAGLLGGFAAWLNCVPCRFYTLRGLRFETTNGVKRRLLVCAERLACHFAHRVICVSESLREKAITSGLTCREKTVVFGSGSSNGVDVQRFTPTPEMMKHATARRSELGIPALAPVIGFVGRLTRDKGIPELVEAFVRLGQQFPDLRLLLLGRFENEDPLPVETRRCLETHPHVILAGHQRGNSEFHLGRHEGENWPVEDAAPYYAVMDVFVLPSHREGFPNVVLEAQAAGKPVAAAGATGVVDAVVDGETGLLFPVGDIAGLADAVARLLRDKALARKLARAGQERVRREFRQEQIWEALYQEYLALLQTRDLPLPLQCVAGRSAADLRRDPMSSRAQEKSKRMFDVMASGTAMILLCPLFALIALAIRISMGPPVLFRHARPGYRAKPFTLFKFRTMTEAWDSEGNLLPDPDRLTPLGRFLRRWSLDELPQLWNVLKGEMSLVGPRPLMMEYLEKYTPEQARRHDVKPGLTGWAQLHGRQDLLFSRRLEMDVWYVDHSSFLFDLKLILLTLLRLQKLSAVGASLGLEKTDDLGLAALIQKRRKVGEPISFSPAKGTAGNTFLEAE